MAICESNNEFEYTLQAGLRQFGKVRTNVLLSKCTTFSIGGPARFLVEVVDGNKLVELLNFLTDEGQNYMVLGGGSNLLMPDEGFDGVVIKINTKELFTDNEKIIADAGVLLGLAVNMATANSLTGLEWAAGIPGTIGGAVRGNAGAMGKDMSRNIEKVEVWKDREVLEMDREDCAFVYRGSNFKNENAVILRAWIKLERGEQKNILAQVKEYLGQRQGKFPPYPSAGCFFKNVKLTKWPNYPKDLPTIFIERGTVPVGWLIDQSGAKGLEVAGAAISDLHCNFIVNKNKASQAEILALVDEVKTKVYNKFGIELEEEVVIIR